MRPRILKLGCLVHIRPQKCTKKCSKELIIERSKSKNNLFATIMKSLDPKVQRARECHLWRQEVGNFIQAPGVHSSQINYPNTSYHPFKVLTYPRQPLFGVWMGKPSNYVKNYSRLLLQLRTLYLKFSKHEMLSLRNTR